MKPCTGWPCVLVLYSPLKGSRYSVLGNISTKGRLFTKVLFSSKHFSNDFRNISFPCLSVSSALHLLSIEHLIFSPELGWLYDALSPERLLSRVPCTDISDTCSVLIMKLTAQHFIWINRHYCNCIMTLLDKRVWFLWVHISNWGAYTLFFSSVISSDWCNVITIKPVWLLVHVW